MAVQTPIANSTYDIVAGSVRMQILKFSSVANSDTFVSDLGTIIAISLESGSTTPNIGATWSGSTVTFLSSSGSIPNMSCVIFGF